MIIYKYQQGKCFLVGKASGRMSINQKLTKKKIEKELLSRLKSKCPIRWKTKLMSKSWSLSFCTEFERWKEASEEEEDCFYSKKTGTKTDNKSKTTVRYYQCNRCGEFKPQKRGQRRIKAQGNWCLSLCRLGGWEVSNHVQITRRAGKPQMCCTTGRHCMVKGSH